MPFGGEAPYRRPILCRAALGVDIMFSMVLADPWAVAQGARAEPGSAMNPSFEGSPG